MHILFLIRRICDHFTHPTINEPLMVLPNGRDDGTLVGIGGTICDTDETVVARLMSVGTVVVTVVVTVGIVVSVVVRIGWVRRVETK